ncbi:hypothetical protein C8R45DRAFT_1096606 [Mycena sanguinolenta]|nr:hypothetical protein C8R45DRAFT_1096606 [Mycena sanguinolenta]
MLPTTINRDSAYADAQPPPKPVVMLVSATNLHLPNHRTLVMHQDLPAQFTSPATLEGAPVPPTPSPPQTVTGPSIHPTPALPAPAASSRHSSPLTNASDSDNSDMGDGHPPKIAAPMAITRKILKNHAEWVDGDIKAEQITKYVHSQAQTDLNTSMAISYQDKIAMENFYRKRQEKFPELKKYAKNWPVKCVLQAHLKITTSAGAKDQKLLKPIMARLYPTHRRAVSVAVPARSSSTDRLKHVRLPLVESVMNQCVLQPCVHDISVLVLHRPGPANRFGVSTFRLFLKRHARLLHNRRLDLKGDIVIMRVGSRNRRSYVDLRSTDTKITDFIIESLSEKLRAFQGSQRKSLHYCFSVHMPLSIRV